jgi:predicted transcriptional regulator
MVSARGKSVRTSVLLPEAWYSQLQAMAEANDVSTSWIVRQAVIRFLSEKDIQTELPLRIGKG